MKKALITGVSGFAGSFLAEHLVEEGKYEVIGTYLTENSLINISSVKDEISLHKLDLQNASSVEKIIDEEKPDMIFHLAALASAGESFKKPKEYIVNNISSEINLLEAIKRADITPKTLIVSSAEVYGMVSREDLPIDENKKLKPANPYAVSKVAQEFLGTQYSYSYKIPIIIVRPFNHIGPRQSPAFVVASFAKRIAAIEAGKEKVLKVGNLSAKRDFTDVRDIAKGYLMLLEKGDHGGIYNIGRGKSYEINDILSKLIKMSTVEIPVEEDDSLLRPIDIEELLCDNQKITAKTGWTPEIEIEETLKDTLDYWRSIN